MTNPLPLGQWLNAPRPDDMPVAWLDDRTWTLGQLRHDVTLLVDTLHQQEGERCALKTATCLSLRCLPRCMPVKRRSSPAIAASRSLKNSRRCLAAF